MDPPRGHVTYGTNFAQTFPDAVPNLPTTAVPVDPATNFAPARLDVHFLRAARGVQ
jgi:hypothetical protein